MQGLVDRWSSQVSRKARTGPSWIVYVDGLNFYAAVRNRPETKWIDFKVLADRLVPSGGSVSKVKYFTSQTRVWRVGGGLVTADGL